MQFITAVHSMCGILAVEPNVIINKCLNQSDMLGHSTAYFKNCLFYRVKTIVNLSVPYVVSKAASVYIKKTTGWQFATKRTSALHKLQYYAC